MHPEVASTVQRLARHLRRHPHACDTCEGIVRWWLADQTPPAIVEAALACMVACGAVESAHAADGRTRFRRAAGAEADAQLDALAGDARPLRPPATAGRRAGVLH